MPESLPAEKHETSILGAAHLSFGYGSRKVLEDVSLSLGPGEAVALVGPNGSGKSTLIRLLTAVLRPASGQVTLNGAPLSHLKPDAIARELAVVAQENVIEFDFSGQEIVLMGRSPYLGPLARESRRDLEIVEAAMEQTGVTHLADRSIRQMSGGERQRVMLARALAQEPRVLLLDEPTAHLDINHQAETLEMTIRLCRERGVACLAVLHDLNLACHFADRVLVLHKGRIVGDGPPASVITPERIEAVFEICTLVIPHPQSGRPVVLLRYEQTRRQGDKETGR